MSFNNLQFQKIIPRYIIICLLGSILVAGASSGLQIWRIKKAISEADVLFKANSVDPALTKLLQAELWATRYPVMAIRLNLAAIKCHVRRKDMRSAEETAAKIFNRKYNTPRRSASLPEQIQYLPNFLIILLWKDVTLTPYSGYEELVSAIRSSGNYDRLVAISRDIIAMDPNSSLAQKVKAYIPVEPKVLAQEKSEPPPVATNKVEEAPLTPQDHRKLLDNYVAQKVWDKALKECEFLLNITPDDVAVLDIRKLAAVNGMRWAVIKQPNAPAYDTSGKFLKAMQPGTMLDVVNLVKTTREGLALCSALAGDNSPAATFLMRCQDISIYYGDIKKIADDDRKLFRKEAELAAGIVTLRAKLVASTIDSQNPYAAEYKAAKAAHEAYWAKVRVIQKKRDEARSGDDKMKYADELRQLKGEDIRLGTALETAKKNYDQSATSSSVNVKSQELDAMETDLATIKERIKSLDK